MELSSGSPDHPFVQWHVLHMRRNNDWRWGEVVSGLAEVSRWAASKAGEERKPPPRLKENAAVPLRTHTRTRTPKHPPTFSFPARVGWTIPEDVKPKPGCLLLLIMRLASACAEHAKKTFDVTVIAYDALTSSKNNIQLILSGQLSVEECVRAVTPLWQRAERKSM